MRRRVYLIGAGASVNAIPITSQTKARMESQIAWINENLEHFSEDTPVKDGIVPIRERETLNLYKGILEEIVRNIDEYHSVDNYALSIKHDFQAFKRLKHALILFYSWVQAESTIDKRYIDFFSLRADQIRKVEWPSEFGFLTWNYDQQIPLAIGRYSSFDDLEDIMHSYRIYPLHKLNRQEYSLDWNKANVIHLNGIAGYHLHNEHIPGLRTMSNRSNDLVDNLKEWLGKFANGAMEIQMKTMRIPYPLIDFFSGSITESLSENIGQWLSDTKQVVVIGYSFPRHNIEMDELILKSLNEGTEIIIQSSGSSSPIEDRLREFYTVDHLDLRVYGSREEFFDPI